MARWIFEITISSDSPGKVMCNNMGFLKNLLSSDFGGHFCHFGLYFMLLSPEEIDVLPMVEPLSFAVSANFRMKSFFTIQFENFLFISGLSRTGRHLRTRTFNIRIRTRTSDAAIFS